LRAGEHEQRTSSVTALQDWLSISPVNPKILKDAVCEAWRGLTAEEQAKVDGLPLMGRGVERC
jgi:hypothetical protein